MRNMLLLLAFCVGCGSSGGGVAFTTASIEFMFNEPGTIWQCEYFDFEDNLQTFSFTISVDGTGFSSDSLLAVFSWVQTGHFSIDSLSGPFIPVSGHWSNITSIDPTHMETIIVLQPGNVQLDSICELQNTT